MGVASILEKPARILVRLASWKLPPLWLIVASFPLFPVFGGVIDHSKPVSASIKPDIVYWNFDDGLVGGSEPTPVLDVAGNGYDGILPKLCFYIEGRFGTGLRLLPEGGPRYRYTARAGESDSDAKLNMAGKAFTAGAWIRLDGDVPGEPRAACVFVNSWESGKRQWRFFIIKDKQDEWTLRFDVVGTPGQQARSLAVPGWSDNAWHHVAFSCQPAEDGQKSEIVFWVDGQKIDEAVEMAGSIESGSGEGWRAWSVGPNATAGAVDDAFLTTGVYSFR